MNLKYLTSFVVAMQLVASVGFAAISPASRHEAGMTKTGNYYDSGFFIGGDKTVTVARLKDIRRGPKSKEGFERIVLDLDVQGESKNSIPHFQVQAVPGEGKVILSIWADVNFDFNGSKIQKAFARSSHVAKVTPLPRVEDGLTIVEFWMKPKVSPKLEVFRLTQPARIILDLM